MYFEFMRWKVDISVIVLFVIISITTLVSSNLNWGKNHWRGIIESDGKGYYAYLPAIFIYKDLNFGFFDEIEKEKYYNQNLYYDYRAQANGVTINKYYCGTALAELPFFLLAHISSYVSGYVMDGYSKPYPILINVAALFYLLIGLVYLNSSLKTFKVTDRSRALTLFAAVFGTHLFYYAVVEPGMSHIYSFAFVSMFFYYSRIYFGSFQGRHMAILATLLGIITLIRPINGLIIFILPFAAGNFQLLKRGIGMIFRHKLWLLFSFCIFFSILSIQFIIYKISTGHFWIYSYQSEGFNFLSPHFIEILFSYKKGLFLYTPLLFLSLLGGYFLWKRSRYMFYSWFSFFFLITYVFSSWWMWYYGGSFSSRVYVEYIPLFMILLGISISSIEVKRTRRLYVLMIALLIIICQIQTYQYRYYYIHWSDMTKEKYWSEFLRIDKLMK